MLVWELLPGTQFQMQATQSLIFRLTERAAVCLREDFIVRTNHMIMILRLKTCQVICDKCGPLVVVDPVNKDKSLNGLLECAWSMCTPKKHFKNTITDGGGTATCSKVGRQTDLILFRKLLLLEHLTMKQACMIFCYNMSEAHITYSIE